MSRPYPYMPGVSAAGHIYRGYWHPGGIPGCPKCPSPSRPCSGAGQGWKVIRGIVGCPECGKRPAEVDRSRLDRRGRMTYPVREDDGTWPGTVPAHNR